MSIFEKKIIVTNFPKFFQSPYAKIFFSHKNGFFKTFLENQKLDIPKMSIFQNPKDFLDSIF